MAKPKCYTMTMDERKARVKELVELFNREKAKYTSKSFKEKKKFLYYL